MTIGNLVLDLVLAGATCHWVLLAWATWKCKHEPGNDDDDDPSDWTCY